MTLSYNGSRLDLNIPKVMGILNLTPDSFFDGGKYFSQDNILKAGEQMLENGADIIDLGGVSTRPGADDVSEQEELNRVLPVLKKLIKQFPSSWISIDTYRSRVAKACVEEGARMVNDISGGNLDTEMFPTIAKLQVPYVLMHMQGIPQTMQENPLHHTVVNEVLHFFSSQVDQLNNLGVKQIILDPGYGFGKTLEANYRLLNHQEKLRLQGLPLLVGVSRKSMINKVLNTSPTEALNGTSILNTIALQNGANILRVHDVQEAVECVRLVEKYKSVSS